jgi:hypothetical protein
MPNSGSVEEALAFALARAGAVGQWVRLASAAAAPVAAQAEGRTAHPSSERGRAHRRYDPDPV